MLAPHPQFRPAMMTPRLLRIGKGAEPVVVIDGFTGAVDEIVSLAEAMAPLPRVAGGFYPGLRRVITERDGDAFAYVERLLQSAAQFIAGAFDADRFSLLEASFSIVTDDPAGLHPAQRAPHFDSTDPNYLAVLHYLNVPGDSGTAFFRQKATGIERIGEANVDRFVASAKAAAAGQSPTAGYIQGSDAAYDLIEEISAVPDRLLIYRGSMLHCGMIPPAMPRSPDPRSGRLTANIFVRLH